MSLHEPLDRSGVPPIIPAEYWQLIAADGFPPGYRVETYAEGIFMRLRHLGVDDTFEQIAVGRSDQLGPQLHERIQAHIEQISAKTNDTSVE